MLFRKRDEYPSDAVNVFAEPVIFFFDAVHVIFEQTLDCFIIATPSQMLILFACQMNETTHKHFAFRNEDSGVSDKEYDMWFAGH